MKTVVIILSLIPLSVSALECKVLGQLKNGNQIEMAFVTSDVESCEKLAEKASETRFFGAAVDAHEIVSAEAQMSSVLD